MFFSDYKCITTATVLVSWKQKEKSWWMMQPSTPTGSFCHCFPLAASVFTSQLLVPSSYTTASALLPDYQPVTGTASGLWACAGTRSRHLSKCLWLVCMLKRQQHQWNCSSVQFVLQVKLHSYAVGYSVIRRLFRFSHFCCNCFGAQSLLTALAVVM